MIYFIYNEYNLKIIIILKIIVPKELLSITKTFDNKYYILVLVKRKPVIIRFSVSSWKMSVEAKYVDKDK